MLAKSKLLFARRQKRARFTLQKSLKGKLRLSVFRSNLNIHVQIIDDVAGNTIVSASTLEKDIKSSLKSTANMAAASLIGETIAKRAKEKQINEVVFDRGGYKYHGRVKAVCEAAREHGLKI
jgi:large subunit ribosomal protein L18